ASSRTACSSWTTGKIQRPIAELIVGIVAAESVGSGISLVSAWQHRIDLFRCVEEIFVPVRTSLVNVKMRIVIESQFQRADCADMALSSPHAAFQFAPFLMRELALFELFQYLVD